MCRDNADDAWHHAEATGQQGMHAVMHHAPIKWPTKSNPLPADAKIAKDLMITKDFYTYSIKIIRQEKILRDHRRGGEPAR
jgi:hypothetical protein